MMENRLKILMVFFLLLACESPFEYHPNQVILEEHERNLNQKNLSKIQEKKVGDTICFAFMGDSQRFYDELEDFGQSVQQRKDVQFIVHSGDISDFGWAKEFKWVHRIMEKLPVPYLTVVGNHDIIANGKEVYRQMYGDFNYSFDYGFARFVFFDSNSREYRFQGNVPDISWIRKQTDISDSSGLSQVIAISHIPPFDADFDPDLEQEYMDILTDNPFLNLSLHGHQHSRSQERPGNGKVLIHVETSINDRTYSVIKIWKDDYSVEKVTY